MDAKGRRSVKTPAATEGENAIRRGDVRPANYLAAPEFWKRYYGWILEQWRREAAAGYPLHQSITDPLSLTSLEPAHFLERFRASLLWGNQSMTDERKFERLEKYWKAQTRLERDFDRALQMLRKLQKEPVAQDTAEDEADAVEPVPATAVPQPPRPPERPHPHTAKKEGKSAPAPAASTPPPLKRAS